MQDALDELRKQLEPRAQDMQTLPKVSVHCHLEGSVRAATFRDLVAKYQPVLLTPLPELGVDPYTFADFGAFLRRFRDICAVLVEPSDYARVMREWVIEALADNIRYAELFISPAAWLRLHPQLELRPVFELLHEEMQRARTQGLEVQLLFDITRNFGPEVAAETVKSAIALREFGVVGVGLGGDEAAWPAPLFADAFTLAKNNGLRCVAHAGEAAGSESVRDAVLILGAERIGHGVRACDDEAVLELLAERNIACEQAPSSNVFTGAVRSWSAHPMDIFVNAGIPVAIDVDDQALFRTTLSLELALVEERFSATFVHDRLHDAINASFAPAEFKHTLRTELDAAIRKRCAETGP